jgi:predicted  nucleic acid-binding Zn-ribbon protein
VPSCRGLPGTRRIRSVERPATPAKSEVAAAEEEEEAEDPFEGVPILHREQGELYLFDVDVETFVLQEKQVTVDIAQGGDFKLNMNA